jgi:hypothetical protein
VTFEYFVAAPAELDGLLVEIGPLRRLGPARAGALPLVDPGVVLPALVEVLAAENRLDPPDSPIVAESSGEGPWVARIDDFTVQTIRGADGDPELEWEDEVVPLWAKRILDALGTPAACDVLLTATDALRRLAAQADAGRHLYCWTKV